MSNSQDRLRFAIFGNEFQAEKSMAIQTLLQSLEKHNADIYIDAKYYYALRNKWSLKLPDVHIFENYQIEADYAIAIGGDGTFLRAAAHMGQKDIPVIGVNMGRLGFLADVLPSEVETTIDSVYDKSYQLECRNMLMVEADQPAEDGKEFYPYALNEISVQKRDTASMISIRVSINGAFLVNYQADGIVAATPTGSTAYSLSNGGPIIVPQTHCICMTPVAPHSLNMRPIVFADDNVIEMEVKSRSHNFLVGIDGQPVKMREGTKLTIRRAPFDVKIVKQTNHRYFSKLREKLMWGADLRR